METLKLLSLSLAILMSGSLYGAPERFVTPIAFDSNVEDVFLSLKGAEIKNVSEAIALFDMQFFKLGNYRLFFQSQSIQPSSKEFPRIVLTGKNSKMFVGLNHRLDPKALEFIQFREKEKTWDFRVISFDKGKAALSSGNSKMCMQCHGAPNAMPNTLRFEAARLERSLPVPSFIRFQPLVQEEFWRAFVSNSKKDPVYSRLELPSLTEIMR